MTIPLMYNFRSLFNKFPTIFSLKFNFSHFILRIKLFFFFAEKGNLKFIDSKMRWEEESEKFSLS